MKASRGHSAIAPSELRGARAQQGRVVPPACYCATVGMARAVREPRSFRPGQNGFDRLGLPLSEVCRLCALLRFITRTSRRCQ
jgi:hypothetical protein